MGYIIGGVTPRAEAGKEGTGGLTTTPNLSPQRSNFRMGAAQNVAAMQKFGGADVTRNAPLFNDPRYTSSTLAIPTDDRSLHGLYRFFAETDPIVGSALRIHVELPLADLELGTCEDTGVQQHFEEQWERINGHKLLSDIVAEYWEIGNVFPFGAFNSTDYMWEQFAILNPDFVKVETTWVNQRPLIKLIPDEALKRVVQTRSPKFIYDQLPQEIVKYVLFNQEIPLDPENIFAISHSKRPYEAKGRSLIKRILKVLMLEDRFNQANFALATRHAVPITVVKVGDPTTGWIPDQLEIDAIRDMFANYELDPNFSIFYHYGIDVQFYGSNGRMLPVGPELDRLYRLKFIGMGVHEQLLSGGGGSYSQAYVNLEIQRQRYLNLQLKLENFVHTGLFKPVADLCGFYKIKQPVAGFGGVKSSKWGNPGDLKNSFMKQYTSIRDFQDNQEFKRFVDAKTAEMRKEALRNVREYVYPKVDWGQMSATTDENLKNYLKWLSDKRPWLVDDATLARLGRLDRDTQEKAYINDLERKQKRLIEISSKGLLPFMQNKPGQGGAGGGGAVDFGGIGDIGVGGGGGDMGPGADMAGGGAPGAPIGQEGPPPAAGGAAPGGPPTSALNRAIGDLADDMVKQTTQGDLTTVQENSLLLRAKSREDWAVEKVIRERD
jgi:hypothetical protein